MNKNRLVLCLVGLLLLPALAVAQVDDRARALLAGLEAIGAPDEIRSLDQTMTMTLHDMGEGMTTTTRTVIDYEGERAAIISQVMGMETVMIYRDGQMSMRAGGMSIPMPPGTEEAFDGIFDATTTAGMLDDPNVSATYDGEVSYADLLAGEQVTYDGNLEITGLPTASGVVRMVFGDSGRLLGQVISTQGQEFIVVYVDDPAQNPLLATNMEMYEYDSDTGAYTHFATMAIDNLAINEAIDESLFQ